MRDQLKDLCSRLVNKNARKLFDPRRLIYFFAFVLVLGNLGTLISFFQYLNSSPGMDGRTVARNFATYTIAIAITAFADYCLRKEKDNTVLLAFLVFAMFSAGAGCIILTVDTKWIIVLSCIVSGLLALALWLLISTSNPDHDDSTAISTLGGQIP